MQYIYSMPL